MPRTIINLNERDKAWLDQQSKATNLPMTELVRRAIRLYRAREQSLQRRDLQAVLERTRGLWKQGDALAYQQRLRDEWD